MNLPTRMRQLARRRLLQPLIALLVQGVTPEKLALSIAIGTGLGVFPVLGVSTVACTAASVALRLNLPAIQLANYLAGPLQLLLIIPFVRLGERLAGSPPQAISLDAGFALLAEGAMRAVVVMWDAIVHAALGWIAVGPALIFGLYRLIRPLLARARRSAASHGATPGAA